MSTSSVSASQTADHSTENDSSSTTEALTFTRLPSNHVFPHLAKFYEPPTRESAGGKPMQEPMFNLVLVAFGKIATKDRARIAQVLFSRHAVNMTMVLEEPWDNLNEVVEALHNVWDVPQLDARDVCHIVDWIRSPQYAHLHIEGFDHGEIGKMRQYWQVGEPRCSERMIEDFMKLKHASKCTGCGFCSEESECNCIWCCDIEEVDGRHNAVSSESYSPPSHLLSAESQDP